jgi:hypothetical protein
MKLIIAVSVAVFSVGALSASFAEGESEQLKPTEQSVVVMALSLVEGFAFSNSYVHVRHDTLSNDHHRVSVLLDHHRENLGRGRKERILVPFAVVDTSTVNPATVEYSSNARGTTGRESAYRAAAAYLAHRGVLTSAFNMSCSQDKDNVYVYVCLDKRRIGGECTVRISRDGISYRGGM